MASPSDVVTRFADSVGQPDEARLYLRHWQKDPPERFALIDVAEVRSDAELATLISDLRYLASVALYPVIAGAGPAIAEAILASDVPATRTTRPEEARESARTRHISVSAVTDITDVGDWLQELASRKIILLGSSGLRTPIGDPISLVNVSAEREKLDAPRALAEGHRQRFVRACELLERAPRTTTASITSPLQLLRELFTVRGAGTLLRAGSVLRILESLAPNDVTKLTELLSNAFGRVVTGNFFDRALAPTIVAGDFRGAALIEAVGSVPYLSKFAVGTTARGEGVGRDLWSGVVDRYPRLLWRARRRNPIAPWYERNCDGLYRSDAWTVFWRGLEVGELAAAIASTLARPSDFG